MHADAAAARQSSSSAVHIEALMPEHHTDHEEAYLCTSVTLPDQPLQLVGVEPLSKQEVVHHMLLFGAVPPQDPPKLAGTDCSVASLG